MVAKAQKVAKVVFKENDPDAIKELINLMDTYGEERIEEALDIIKQKNIDNPKYNFRYLVGIIENE